MKSPANGPLLARLPFAAAVLCSLAVLGLPALTGNGQTKPQDQVAPPPPKDVSLVISQEGARRIPLAIPPAIAPLNPELQGRLVDPFHRTLTSDLGSMATFILADPSLFPKGARPTVTREQGDAWIASGAQFLLDTQIQLSETQAQPGTGQVIAVAQLVDLRTLKVILSKSYTGTPAAVRKIAHTLANDLARQFTGQPGPFLSKIAFVSDRDGGQTKEIYAMDWDGEGQRRLTGHRSLSLAPDFSYDGSKIAYQSFNRGPSGIFVIASDGGAAKQVPLTTSLNASPSFSPDGKQIAFCGSVKGNPEIFTVNADGSYLKRLTDSPAIDSTPRWSPNGREIAFTSNRQGGPQIYLMDAEGANVRRITFAGTWNDEASFSPKGSQLAFSCRNEGDFQICVLDLLSGRTFQITNGGANENPTWSPDGSKIAWEVRRGDSSQIAVANPDGSGMRVITALGNNTSPTWSRNLD